jgi:DNA-binding FadR family transcriptional regulator
MIIVTNKRRGNQGLMSISNTGLRGELLQQAIQEQIKQFIIEQHLESGAELPSETELASHLGVSRNAIREALKVLQTLDIVETRHGQGSFVGRFSLNALADGLAFRILFDVKRDLRTLRELLEIRQVLECELVSRLAEQITTEQLARLNELVQAMSEKAQQGQIFPEEDRAFHVALYQPLGNHLMIQILQAFWDAFHSVRDLLPGNVQSPIATVEVHQRIVDMLQAGNGAEAAAAMAVHFAEIQARLAARNDQEGKNA